MHITDSQYDRASRAAAPAGVASRVALMTFVAMAALIAPGCSSCGEKKAPEVRKVEPVEGMRYFVGGPVMKPDKYGRTRLARFNGEVKNPTPRGLLIGFKKNPDGTFDFRTWLNGMIVSQSDGFLDDEGLLWYTKRVSYDSEGAVVVEQTFEYDDEAKVMKSAMRQLDAETGEVIDEHVQDLPYTPSADPEDDKWFDDEEDDDDGEE